MDKTSDNRRTPTEIRKRKKRFFLLLCVCVLLAVSPAAKVFAANVDLGNIWGSTFNKNAGDGAHLMPGDTISWGVGGTVGSPTNDFTVNYRVGTTTYSYGITDTWTGIHSSGADIHYTVLTLAAASGGANTGSLAYWELSPNSITTTGTGFAERVTSITLVACFADPSREEPAAPPHEHYLYWKETIPATEDAEGEICYLCDCGYVEYRIPTSANAVFIQNTINKIVKAPYGSTVDISTVRWSAFTGAVAEAFAKRPDVSMNLTFRQFAYRGNRLKTTIPAGSDLTQYLDENGYVGFNTLAANFGAVRVP